jgi:lipopolysaccharide/colanic/teichoic acid biosynthesis glycosyltransferase
MAVESSVPAAGGAQHAVGEARQVIGLTGPQAAVKRGFDLVGASLLLILTSPVWLVVAVAVKLTSPGPVFFRLPSIGKDGKVFGTFKFRSMVQGAHAQFKRVTADIASGPMAKVRDDPRVTPVGRFLRRFSLDELPQLLNVLLGQMSLVGPRPLSAARYDERFLTGWHAIRLTVLPGMTGLWQVSGRVQDFEACCRIDEAYIGSWSLLRDIWILIRTPFAMLSERGAG